MYPRILNPPGVFFLPSISTLWTCGGEWLIGLSPLWGVLKFIPVPPFSGLGGFVIDEGVNLANVLDEGLRIGGRGHRMNSKVKIHTNKVKLDAFWTSNNWLNLNLSLTGLSWPYI
jgi:hypothetical protein